MKLASNETINESTETNLVSDSSSCKGFGNNAKNNSEHRHATVEKLDAFQLCHVNFPGSSVLKPLVIC